MSGGKLRMPHPRRQSFRCELLGHKPFASEWRAAGRPDCWVRVVWCARCGTYRDEGASGPKVAPLSLVQPL